MASISFDVAIPASTTEAAPVEKTAPVGRGLIRSIKTQFPAGCQYLAKLKVLIAAPGNPRMPLLPSYLGGTDAKNFIALDDDTQDWPVNYPVAETTLLYVRAWNDDTVNAHTLKVIVNLGPLEGME